MSGKGLFVSFEGIDGSGKSTQARRLADSLRAEGRDVLLTREPGGSPGAEEIRALVLQGDPDRWSAETELLLFTAARRDHLERTIRPALAEGRVVICDRFADSSRMYQGRDGRRAQVDALHDLMIGVEPDVTLLIDMDPRSSLERSLRRLSLEKAGLAVHKELEFGDGNHFAKLSIADAKSEAVEAMEAYQAIQDGAPEDRFESFGLPLQQAMRAGFLALAQEFPARFRVIEGNRAMEDVAADVRAALEPLL